jgi:hypothetical protein
VLVETQDAARVVGDHLEVLLQSGYATRVEGAACIGVDKIVSFLHAIHHSADDIRLPLPVAEAAFGPAVFVFLVVPGLEHVLVAHIDMVEEAHLFSLALDALLRGVAAVGKGDETYFIFLFMAV